MAKLQSESLEGKDLSTVLTTLGKKFLGKDAALTSFEELEAGVSYNYIVEFGDKKFILKIDNPTVGMRAALKDVSGDNRSDDERFNLIARFVNEKVERGLQAPTFLPVIGRDGEFCVTADQDDESLPKEFRGTVVSMQTFLEKGKAVQTFLEKGKAVQIPSASQARSLGDNLGKLHRPSSLAQKFPVPSESAKVADSRMLRQDLEKQFGKTRKDRVANYETSSAAVEHYMASLNSSSVEVERKLYTEMLKYFPDGKCSAETLGSVIETACVSQPKQDLSTMRQISHNDLHSGNMLVVGTEVTLIDFDELGRAGVTEDLWTQIERVLKIFRGEASENPIPRLELLEEFLCGYLAHNPYLSRSEFQAVEDLTNMIVAGLASLALAGMVTLATSPEKPTREQVENLANRISGGDWMPAFLTDSEKQKEEKDVLGVIYDKVFAKISRGTSVESLTLDRSQPKARDPLAHLDLASGSERKSWVERQKRESEASKGTTQKIASNPPINQSRN